MPEETRRRLKARAASCGESLNTYLLDIVTREVERPTVAEVLERAVSRAERAEASAVGPIAQARTARDRQVSRSPGR